MSGSRHERGEDCANCGQEVGDAHLRTVTATESRFTCAGRMPHPTIEGLIERSSLGTPEAKAAREAADPAMVARVMERVRAERIREPSRSTGGDMSGSRQFIADVLHDCLSSFQGLDHSEGVCCFDRDAAVEHLLSPASGLTITVEDA